MIAEWPAGAREPLDETPLAERIVLDLERAHVAVALRVPDLVVIDRVVKDHGLAALKGVDVGFERARAAMTRKDVEQSRANHFFACGPVVLNGRVVGVGEDEVDHPTVIVADCFKDDVRVHE